MADFTTAQGNQIREALKNCETAQSQTDCVIDDLNLPTAPTASEGIQAYDMNSGETVPYVQSDSPSGQQAIDPNIRQIERDRTNQGAEPYDMSTIKSN